MQGMVGGVLPGTGATGAGLGAGSGPNALVCMSPVPLCGHDEVHANSVKAAGVVVFTLEREQLFNADILSPLRTATETAQEQGNIMGLENGDEKSKGVICRLPALQILSCEESAGD